MTEERRSRPRVRLLWDEDLSSLVPQALRILGFPTTYVGANDQGVPAKGSTDRDVVEYARRANQVIVTHNHDMMTLCAELGQRFVWLDPRGKQLTREAQVLLVFQQIARWEAILTQSPEACVHARRTRCEQIAPEEAARLATARMRALARRRQRVRAKRAPESGNTLEGL